MTIVSIYSSFVFLLLLLETNNFHISKYICEDGSTSIVATSTIRVFDCLRQPSSKQRKSTQLIILMHKYVSVDEEKVFDGRKQSENAG